MALLAAAALALPGLGLATAGPAGAVTGGSDTTGDATGFVAKLQISELKACTGALVAPQWVVTARSCFEVDGALPETPPPTVVTVGRTDLAGTGGLVASATKLVPRTDRDVVLVKLSARTADVTPATVSGTPPAAGNALRLAGFGRTTTTWAPDVLQNVGVDVAAPAGTTVDFTPATGGSACKGDAGAPVFRDDTTHGLVALVSRSWQGGCLDVTETRTGGVAARLDDLGGWITATTRDLVQGDVDGDGLADVAGKDTGGALWWARNTTTGTTPGLAARAQLSTGWSGVRDPMLADLDGDARNDVVGRVGDVLKTWPGSGSPGSPSFAATATDLGTGWAAVGRLLAVDVDGDGRVDVAGVDSAGALWWGRNTSTGSTSALTAKAQLPPALAGVRDVLFADLDGDGRKDVVGRAGDTLRTWRNTGNTTFAAATDLGTGWGALDRLTAYDADGDDRTDVVGTDVAGTLWWGRNTGTGTTPAVAAKAQLGGGWGGVRDLQVLDLDNDRRADLVGRTGDTLKLWRGTGSAGQPAVASPVTLSTGWGPIGRRFVQAGPVVHASHVDGVSAFYNYDSQGTRLWTFTNVATAATPNVTWYSGPNNWEWTRAKTVSGDFDGDGRPDALGLYNYDNSRSKLWGFFTITGGAVTGSLLWDSGAGNWDWNRTKLLAGDFNGDGKDDLAALYRYDGFRTGLWLMENVASGNASWRMAWDSGAGNWDLNRTKAVAGDVNGDGKDDIAALYGYDGQRTAVWVMDAVTSGGAWRIAYDSGPGIWDWNRTKVVAGDFTGDGRDDLDAYYAYDGGRTRLFVMDGVAGAGSWRQVWDSGVNNWDGNRAVPVAGDFDGDGRDDVGNIYDYGNAQLKLWLNTDAGASGAARIVWDSGPGNWEARRADWIRS